jgi:hypothetical protein
MLVIPLSVALFASVLIAQGRAQEASKCAAPVPIDEITAGMTGRGRTVERGTEPARFDAEVLGVLADGIAPGVDLIIADLESAAIERAGVWAGMSGSPVYAEDGRLIGAVAYSLSSAPSSIAGITPAEAMFELYGYPGVSTGQRMNDEVSLPAAMRRKAAKSGTAADQVGDGMSQLRLPLAVSSLRPARFEELVGRLGRDVSVTAVPANRAAAGSGPASDIVAGSNFAAALSYGDLTVAGVGTTTDVCRGTALAFGHPMLHDGRTSLSAHSADAIVVQPDAVFGSFKLTNIGGVVGRVDQDRLTALRAPLGDDPRPTVVRSRIRSTSLDNDRTARTWVNRSKDVPNLATFHVLANLDRMLDTVISEGRTQLTWTAEGTTKNGSPWKIRRANRFAAQGDASFASVAEMLEWLYAINTNRFTAVDVDRISVTGSVDESFQRLRLGDVRVAVNGGKFRRIGAIERLRVRAGDVINVRAPLIRYRQQTPSRTVNLRMEVPPRLAGRSMQVGVFGGESLQGEVNIAGGTSFDDILARMRRQESNNDVVARLQVSGEAGPQVLGEGVQSVGNVVGGRRTLPVTVARSQG